MLFYHLKTQLIKFMQKRKNYWRYQHLTNINQKSQSYDVRLLRYRVRQTEIFVKFLAIFCSFIPLIIPKTIFFKNETNAWRYYPFTRVYHKWRSYDIWYLKYKARQTEFFCHFGSFFCCFIPLTIWKIKILNNLKKYLEKISALLPP